MNKLLRLSDGNTESRRCSYVGTFDNIPVYTLDSTSDARTCFARNGVLWSIDYADRCQYLCDYLINHGHDKLVQELNTLFETHVTRLRSGEYSLMNGWMIAYIGKEDESKAAMQAYEAIKAENQHQFALAREQQEKDEYLTAKAAYISGESPVEFDHLMQMVDEFGIEMAARTKGWFNQYVISVRYDTKTNSFLMKYSAKCKPSSKASTVLYGLREAIIARTEVNHHE